MKQPREQYVYIVLVGFKDQPLATYTIHSVYGNETKAQAESRVLNTIAETRNNNTIQYYYSKHEVH